MNINEQYQYYVEQILNSWDGQPKERAIDLINKYEFPHEATMSRFIWYNNGPWKRTILYRESVPHYFPTPHVDFLTQTIDYRTPLVAYDDIAKFDGSVYPDRTRGEVSANCHMEEMNMLAINLFHDIVTQQKSVYEARMFYMETAKNYIENNIVSPYMKELQFHEQYHTVDPDISYFLKNESNS
jgi:hypothetical protein